VREGISKIVARTEKKRDKRALSISYYKLRVGETGSAETAAGREHRFVTGGRGRKKGNKRNTRGGKKGEVAFGVFIRIKKAKGKGKGGGGRTSSRNFMRGEGPRVLRR